MNQNNVNDKEERIQAFELGKAAFLALDSKKAHDIKLLGLSKETIIADYFVIATGTSSTHIKSLADEVEFKLFETLQVKPNHIEGFGNSTWILLDYGSIIVHIFTKDAREFYNLERLWVDAENIQVETSEQ